MCGFIFQKKTHPKKVLDKKQFFLASKLIFNRGPDNKTFYHDKNHNIFMTGPVSEIKNIKIEI